MSLRPAALIVAAFVAVPVFADPVRIDLGGPRQARAEIETSDRDVTVTLSMRPVQAFDASTNEEVSAEIARELALRALAQHLASGKDIRVEIAGEQLVKSRLEGNRYVHVLRLPAAGVRRLKGTETAAGGRVLKADAFQGRLFTAKQDHLDTLAALAAVSNAQLRKIRTLADQAPPSERNQVFAQALTTAQERATADLDRLEKTVRDDELLTDNTEKPELLDAIAAERSRLRQRISKIKAAEETLRKFTRVELKSPFDEYLTAEPLPMQLGGAIVVDLPGDRKALIGIAKTIMKDDSPEDQLRAEKVCLLKAKAALIAERDGSEISYLKQVKDRIEVVKDESGEKASSVSELTRIGREKVQGIARNMPIVGRWRSADGKTMYLAVGTIISAQGEPLR